MQHAAAIRRGCCDNDVLLFRYCIPSAMLHAIAFVALTYAALCSGAPVSLGGGSDTPPSCIIREPAAPLPIPTPQQLRYQASMNALVHFGMATFFHDGDPGCDRDNW